MNLVVRDFNGVRLPIQSLGIGGEVVELLRWVKSCEGLSLPSALVPGTDEDERRNLANLGGIAKAVAGSSVLDWPEPLKSWAENAPSLPSRLARDLHGQSPNLRETFETLYECLVSGRSRRRLGTFFTPTPVVEFLLERSENVLGVPSEVIDPGAGIGAISLAAHCRWQSARILAVDVNTVTLGMLAAVCAARKIDRVELVFADYLTWIRESLPVDSGPRLFVGNPPYTRYQELPREIRSEYLRSTRDLISSKRASLSAYFLASSLKALRPQDGLAFVLPGSWTEAHYGRRLSEALWEQHHRRVDFYPFPLDTIVFHGALVTALVVVVGPRKSSRQVISVSSSLIGNGEVHVGAPRVDPRYGAKPANIGLWLWPRPQPPSDNGLPTVELGELARVRRGVATGANKFFFLTDHQRDQIPTSATIPGLVRLGYVEGDTLDRTAHDRIGARGERRWLLWLLDENLLLDDSIRALIGEGEREGLNLRYLTSRRNPWYLVEDVPAPDIFVGSMGRNKLRSVQNLIRAVPSNSMYGIYLKDKPCLARPLTNWLNSSDGQSSLRSVARTYAGGLYKIEPSNLLGIRVPSPNVLLGLQRRETERVYA